MASIVLHFRLSIDIHFCSSRLLLLLPIARTLLILTVLLQSLLLHPKVVEAFQAMQHQRHGVLQQLHHQHQQPAAATCEAGGSLELSVSEVQLTRVFSCSSETPHLWPELNAEQQQYCVDDMCSTKAPLTGATLSRIPQTSTYFLNVLALPTEPQKWKFFCSKEPWSSSLVHDQKCKITVDVIPATLGNCYQSGGSVEVAIPAGGGKVPFNCGTAGYAGLAPADPLKVYDSECTVELPLSSISPTAVRTAVQAEAGTQAPFRTFTLEVSQLPPVPVKICYLCAAGQAAAAAPSPAVQTAAAGQAAGATAAQAGKTKENEDDEDKQGEGMQGAPVNARAPVAVVPAAPAAALAVQPATIPVSYISLRNAQPPPTAAPPPAAAAAATAPPAAAAVTAPPAAAAPGAAAPAAVAAPPPAPPAVPAAPPTAAAASGTAGGPPLVTSSPEMRNKACKVYVTIPASAIHVTPHLLLTTGALLFTLVFDLVH